jgi:hypothetical protein
MATFMFSTRPIEPDVARDVHQKLYLLPVVSVSVFPERGGEKRVHVRHDGGF